MITKETSSLGKFLSFLHLPGTEDTYTNWTIPDRVNHRFIIKDRSVLSLLGPKDNLVVTLQTPQGSYLMNNLLPHEVQFEVSDRTLNNRVVADMRNDRVVIPTQEAHRDSLTYALIHGIMRFRFHQDPSEHNTSLIAHNTLNKHNRLSHLEGIGQVELPDDPFERRGEIEAWAAIAAEEIQVSKFSLRALEGIQRMGTNPLPHIRSANQLIHLVNGPDMVRTLSQRSINLKSVEEQIGIKMTLSPDYIATYFHQAGTVSKGSGIDN